METGRLSGNSHRLSAVKRDLENLHDKIDIVDSKVETLRLKLNPVSGDRRNMFNQTDERSRRLLDLERKNELHSRKLQLLQKEMEHVQTENDILIEHMGKHELHHNDSPRNVPRDVYSDKMQDDRKFNNSRASLHSKHSNHDNNGLDKRLMPNTPDRHQPTTEHRLNKDSGRDIESPRKERDQTSRGKIAEEKDTTFKGTADKDFDFEEYQRQRRAQIYSHYDSTAINPQCWTPKQKHHKYPWFDHKTHHNPGGFLIIRFDDSGCDVATVALKSQQSICRHAGGYLMGIARCGRIFVYENAPSKVQNWSISRKQPYDDCLMTDHSLAVLWFTKREAAEYFFENGHHNRWREPCFPTPNGHEAFYVPLSEPPTRQLNSFFVFELLDARMYKAENLTQFEGEVREDMLRYFPDCHPLLVSSQMGRVVLKPGNMISHNSKLYISRFESQRDIDRIWQSGMITGLRKKWDLMAGHINAYSFTIDFAP
ncbi:uncharacterized protein LOC132749926 [Ruditapes philippinarum]|uniref:uncharacterized protein LOC132749926 n=1 Tax=Ruditapes philippinarum TaxID=129788 RepID=UPI00295B12C2|nr:uncharacterized protein LOC132749926 [Ruditapes philippinarum]